MDQEVNFFFEDDVRPFLDERENWGAAALGLHCFLRVLASM